eukprot:TRINITY_DN10560_c2_g1_i3.p1 TRINITY_DN10560_c2_g1~~TRINITY_DN10560_c2_g1_i3.p1  ORF type:complete len:515 (+),score=82.29 TRINITY_DN10560_c2_g1_i3:74-1546(+)
MANSLDASVPLSSSTPSDWKSILDKIVRNAVPAIFTFLLSFINETTNALFIGHHGTKEMLAAVGIGNMLQNCFGLSIGIGLASALDTLVSQAHGAGDMSLAAIYLGRGKVVCSVQMLWILPVLLFSDKWLIAIGQDPVIASHAADYNRAAAPFLICWFWSSCMRRFLSNVQYPNAGVVVALICAILHVLWCYIFVAQLGMGNQGLGLANGITWTLRLVLLSGCLCWYAPDIKVPSKRLLLLGPEDFTGLWQYFRIAFPALLQTCSEWWFWEIIALFIGYLGSNSLAAHVTTQNIFVLLFMIPVGVSQAAATLTGNALGAGQPRIAKQTAFYCLAFMVAVWAVVAALMAPARMLMAEAYTEDPEVQKLVCTLLSVQLVAGVFDSAQSVLGGACRGAGKLKAASVTYLWSFYAVMLPLALFLAFPLRDGIVGIYWAMVIGTFLAASALATTLLRADWTALAAATQQRLRDDATSAQSASCARELNAAEGEAC